MYLYWKLEQFYVGLHVLNQNYTEQISELFEISSQYIQELSKVTLGKSEINELMRDLKYESACNKILRFYRKKKAEMTRSALYAYSHEAHDEEDTKNNNIRN